MLLLALISAPLPRAPFMAATAGCWGCCSGSGQRQKREIHGISQKPDDHQAPSLPPTGYWMRLDLCRELSSGLAFPVQETEMDLSETRRRTCPCTLVFTGLGCIPRQPGHTKATGQQELWLRETAAQSGRVWPLFKPSQRAEHAEQKVTAKGIFGLIRPTLRCRARQSVDLLLPRYSRPAVVPLSNQSRRSWDGANHSGQNVHSHQSDRDRP